MLEADLRSDEREPPVPPGKPTALNKERVGQCDEALRRGIEAARGRSPWKPQSGIALGSDYGKHM